MDELIISLILNEDEDGLLKLQMQYSNLIRYVIRGILTDERDAEECLSDVYYQIWRKISTYEHKKGSLPTWITVIARNTALNYKKKHKSITSELKEEGSDAYSPEALVLEKETQISLICAINKLSNDDKRLFYRKFYFLQTISVIAAEMGISERAAEGRLYRIKKKIEKQWG